MTTRVVITNKGPHPIDIHTTANPDFTDTIVAEDFIEKNVWGQESILINETDRSGDATKERK